MILSLLPHLSYGNDESFLEGLRERRLFRTAESYCQEHLAVPKLDEAQRATLTIEYMLTLSEHALYAPPAERERYWKTAQDLGEKFPREHPHKLVVDLQAALVVVSQGELARLEAEASNAEDFTKAQALLRDASQQLVELERRVAQQLTLKRDLQDKAALTADELFALQHNLHYQLARARRNQGLCYKAGSDDRVAALGQAIEQLGKLRTQVAADQPLAWRISIDEGICHRLLEDYAAGTRVLSTVLADGVPLPLQLHARAELARIALATGRPAEAARVLQAGRASAEMVSAEFEFAQLELLVAQWKQADLAADTQNAGRYRQQAVAQLAAIERQFGAYWARRGEWLVIGSAGAGEENVDILAKTADARFNKKQFDDETVKIYDQAASMSLTDDKLKRYLELGYRAAIVQHRRQQVADAARRLLELGETLGEHAAKTDELTATAAAAHLQGLRWLRALPEASEQQTKLTAAYQRHLQLFPTGVTQGAAALELGELFEQAEQWNEAITAYKTVPAAHDLYPQACVRSARLTLEHTRAGHAAAEALLTEALDKAPPNADDVRSSAQALLVVALAGQPAKRASAEQMLVELGTTSPARLLEMLDGLTRLARSSREEVRRELATLQLRAIDLVQPSAAKLTPQQRLALARIQADALLVSGKRVEALATYERLAKEHPGSATLQEGYATALAAADDRASLTQALGQWRTIAQRTKPRTERWYRAKYEVALLNFRLGEKAQAAQLIKYLQATPPGLDGTPYEAKFLELLRKCES